MDSPKELYRQIIINHGEHPHHFGTLEVFTDHSIAKNPYCGDTFDIFIHCKNNILTDIRFSGEGCLASKASASIMTDLVIGKELPFIKDLTQQAKQLILDPNLNQSPTNMGDFAALLSFKQYSARQHCVLLCWNILDTLLKNI